MKDRDELQFADEEEVQQMIADQPDTTILLLDVVMGEFVSYNINDYRSKTVLSRQFARRASDQLSHHHT
jgi:hypothetical protein